MSDCHHVRQSLSWDPEKKMPCAHPECAEGVRLPVLYMVKMSSPLLTWSTDTVPSSSGISQEKFERRRVRSTLPGHEYEWVGERGMPSLCISVPAAPTGGKA